jgi:hypothetical protein
MAMRCARSKKYGISKLFANLGQVVPTFVSVQPTSSHLMLRGPPGVSGGGAGAPVRNPSPGMRESRYRTAKGSVRPMSSRPRRPAHCRLSKRRDSQTSKFILRPGIETKLPSAPGYVLLTVRKHSGQSTSTAAQVGSY